MKKSFTLIEIMIVIAILALLAALTLPNLLRAKINANESAAIASLHLISSAAQSYRAANPTFPANLSALGRPHSDPPYIDDVLGCPSQPCQKQGYNFTLSGSTDTFIAIAYPQDYGKTGKRSFCVDESGVIRYTTSNITSTSACDSTFGKVLE